MKQTLEIPIPRPVYICSVCGLWSRKEYKVLVDGKAYCCGKVMEEGTKYLFSVPSERDIRKAMYCFTAIIPKNRVGGTGRPKKEESSKKSGTALPREGRHYKC